MRHAAIAACALAAWPALAQHVATVVVEGTVEVAGPTLVARNEQAPARVRASRDAQAAVLDVQMQDARLCLRGVAMTAASQALARLDDARTRWLPTITLALGGERRTSSGEASSNPVPQQQPAHADPAPPSTLRKSARVSVNPAAALGAVLSGLRGPPCETQAQPRFALASGLPLQGLRVEIDAVRRDASDAPAARFVFVLDESGAGRAPAAAP